MQNNFLTARTQAVDSYSRPYEGDRRERRLFRPRYNKRRANQSRTGSRRYQIPPISSRGACSFFRGSPSEQQLACRWRFRHYGWSKRSSSNSLNENNNPIKGWSRPNDKMDCCANGSSFEIADQKISKENQFGPPVRKRPSASSIRPLA